MCGARVRAGRWRFSRRALRSEALHSSGHTFWERKFVPTDVAAMPSQDTRFTALSLTLFSLPLLSPPLPLLACPMRLPRAHSHG